MRDPMRWEPDTDTAWDYRRREPMVVLLPGSSVTRRDVGRATKAVRRRRARAACLVWLRALCPRFGGWR